MTGYDAPHDKMVKPSQRPRLREGVTLEAKRIGKHTEHFVVDAAQGLRMAVPATFHEVASYFERDDGDPPRVRSGVMNSVIRVLETYFLIDSDRSRAWSKWMTARRAVTSDGKLRVLSGARYSCRACGDCCRGFGLGPLTDADVARIRAHDWDHATPDELFHQGEEGRLYLALRDEHCIFLADDNKCIIHARYGAEEKPRFCRDFPYRQTQNGDGRMDLTLRFACSNIHRSRTDGEPLADQTEALQAYFAEEKTPKTQHMPLEVFETGVALPSTTVFALDELLLRVFETDRAVEEQILGCRAVLQDTVRRLRPQSTVERVEALEQWLDKADTTAFFEAVRTDRAACLTAFARIVGTLVDGAMRRFFRLRSLEESLPGGEHPQQAIIVSLLTLQRRLAEQGAHRPPLLSRFDHAAVSAVDDAGDDPQVAGLARDFFRNQIRCRFAAASSNMMSGYASIIVLYLLAKWHAKQLARAAGRARLSHDDLMGGFIAVQRHLGDVLNREVFRHHSDELRVILQHLFFEGAVPV